jgi:hypothetical protein
MDLPPAEQLLASAIQYLIQGNDTETALVMLFCDAEYGQMHRTPQDAYEHFTVCPVGSRIAFDASIAGKRSVMTTTPTFATPSRLSQMEHEAPSRQ